MEELFKALEAIFSLWGHKEANKYKDEFIELKTRWYVESNKPDSDRDNAVLDNLRAKLRILTDAVTSKVGEPNS